MVLWGRLFDAGTMSDTKAYEIPTLAEAKKLVADAELYEKLKHYEAIKLKTDVIKVEMEAKKVESEADIFLKLKLAENMRILTELEIMCFKDFLEAVGGDESKLYLCIQATQNLHERARGNTTLTGQSSKEGSPNTVSGPVNDGEETSQPISNDPRLLKLSLKYRKSFSFL